ncbi:hypothetical protein [Cellulomonas marina]|uniref:Uncharacterized protein n=1 Tax=Cellulomonas marina TaxID=988821 RepID=A0A1I0W6M0_9CELL|nr:hypothetical protein [Cellulomonas marina]GIG29141.1 hypothetical protein Cma02nite_17410 [Cellulomonas marina]SFA84419.1 hypothetical protein SAMN05421867_102239 [Cellulomonas marina]
MIRGLLWAGAGAVATVVVARRARAAVDAHVPPAARDVLRDVSRWSAALELAREDFAVALAEREEELKARLLGDTDVDALRRQRRDRQAVGAGAPGRRGRAGWSDAPTDDPDDDDRYPFF